MRCRNAATQNRSEVVSSSPGEAIEIGAAQVMLHRQVAEGLIQAGNDVFRPGKQTTALRHIHGPEFPGPFEYILENVPVNGLEVTHHECRAKGRCSSCRRRGPVTSASNSLSTSAPRRLPGLSGGQKCSRTPQSPPPRRRTPVDNHTPEMVTKDIGSPGDFVFRLYEAIAQVGAPGPPRGQSHPGCWKVFSS